MLIGAINDFIIIIIIISRVFRSSAPSAKPWWGYDDFDIGFDHVSRVSRLYSTQHSLCDTPYSMPMLIGYLMGLQSDVISDLRLQVYDSDEIYHFFNVLASPP